MMKLRWDYDEILFDNPLLFTFVNSIYISNTILKDNVTWFYREYW
jgi:hypothetical protein